jgi:hypothetical protein
VSGRIPRIGRSGVGTFHGPVEIRPRENHVQLVTFVGAEEGDLLHAAGAWMTEHLDAVLIGVNWVADYLDPHEQDPPGPPRHRLDLTVDLTNEALRSPRRP